MSTRRGEMILGVLRKRSSRERRRWRLLREGALLSELQTLTFTLLPSGLFGHVRLFPELFAQHLPLSERSRARCQTCSQAKVTTSKSGLFFFQIKKKVFTFFYIFTKTVTATQNIKSAPIFLCNFFVCFYYYLFLWLLSIAAPQNDQTKTKIV